MRKTDISKFKDDSPSTPSLSAGEVVSSSVKMFFKLLLTLFLILIVTGIVIGSSLLVYIINLSNEEQIDFDLRKLKLSLTSYVYVMQDDNPEQWVQYQPLYSSENRVWVDYQDIPKYMIEAQIAIEDKRFLEHEGIDMRRTGGAIISLATGKAEYGGSTITQQLIKNITEDNEVSLTRKLREIFRALKLEKEYTKDEIIEAYLNIVNYGSGCRGVQSAAKLYFNKNIQDCSIAECAAIAGITQNPVAYDPLNYPDKNRERREVVIKEMYEQEKITKAQYDEAMKDSANMKFVGYIVEGDDDEESDWNWYMDRLFRDVASALSEKQNIGISYAEQMIYNGGLQIYSAMDLNAQEIAERKVREWKTPGDTALDVGYELMDFEGRVLATVGGRQEREGVLLWDNATQSVLQPGSTIKPVSSFVLALEDKEINFSSLISDRPVSEWGLDEDGSVISGPNNWYRQYYGDITVTRALNISSNAAAVSVIKDVGLDRSYQFLTESLNFQHLDAERDKENLAGLSIGGFYGGTTVEEMTASYQMFCNGGYYYEPYTFYYVTDSDGNVILDNRDRGKPDQIISTESATIMNRLLHEVVNAGGEALGYRAKIDGWDIIGKTGTTDASYDNWFVGASPYAVSGIWTGHKKPAAIPEEEQGKVHYLWRDIMQEWLEGKDKQSFNLGGDVEQHNYIISSGLLTSVDVGDGSRIATGYYTADNMPSYTSYNPYAPAKSTENSGGSESSSGNGSGGYDDDDDDESYYYYDGDDDDDEPYYEPDDDEPTDEPSDEPGDEPTDEPGDEPGGDEPTDEPGDEPVYEPADEPADNPVDEPGGDEPTEDNGGDEE